MFAIPYERDFTLIGTTDENFRGDPAGVAPSPNEIGYLCETASRYFRETVTPDDIVYAFAGVRSLYDDGSKRPEDVTRDYHLDFDKSFGAGAAAHGLWRQDHDLSQARRKRDEILRQRVRADPAVDRARASAGRQLSL